MKALVTGGCGFIGSHIASLLLLQGHEVTILDNAKTPLPERAEGATLIRASITDAKKVHEACKGCGWVFHEAAMISVPESFKRPEATRKINVEGTLNVLEACRKNDVECAVLASSAAVYGDSPSLPKKETDSPSPQSPYGESKLQNEKDAKRYFEEHSLNAVSLRYFNVYGPGQKRDSGVIPRFISLALEGKPPVIYGDGKQTRDFVFVKDVAEANLLCAGKAGMGGKALNIGTGRETSLVKLWEAICAVLGCEIEPVFEKFRKGDISRSVADIGEAERLLGYKPAIALEEGIRKTADWLRMQKA